MASTSQESEEKVSVDNSLNLFTEPHNRMKELCSWPLTEAAEVSDVHELEPSLQAIYEAMWEMKTHEYIENHYIMDTLKQRLQSRRVRKDAVLHQSPYHTYIYFLPPGVQRIGVQLSRRLQAFGRYCFGRKRLSSCYTA